MITKPKPIKPKKCKECLNPFTPFSSFQKCCGVECAIAYGTKEVKKKVTKDKRVAFKGSGDQLYDSDLALFYVLNDEGARTLICTKNRQDDHLFAIPIELNARGRTVLRYEAGYSSQDNNTKQPVQIFYEEKIQAGMIL